MTPDARGDGQQPAGFAVAEQRIEGGDHRLLGEQVEGQHLAEFLAVDLRHRRQRAEHRRVQHQQVERRPPIADRDRQPGDAVGLGKVERCDRRAAARRMDAVVHLLEAGLGPRCQDHMRARRRQRFGRGGADAPAGARDQSDLVVEKSSQFLLRHPRLIRCAVPRTAQCCLGGITCRVNGWGPSGVHVTKTGRMPAFAGMTGYAYRSASKANWSAGSSRSWSVSRVG
jgi:hypothetical protein